MYGQQPFFNTYHPVNGMKYLNSGGIKTCKNGNLVFTNTYAGSTVKPIKEQMVVTRISKNGDIKWTLVLDKLKSYEWGKILEDTEGNLYLPACYNNKYSSIVKISSFGQLLWAKNYGKLDIFDIALTNSGEIIGVATLLDPYKGFYFKTDKDGKLLWARATKNFSSFNFSAVETTEDGGMIAIIASAGFNYKNLILLKINANGGFGWAKSINNIKVLHAKMIKTGADNYTIMGNSQYGIEEPPLLSFYINFDATGNISSQRFGFGDKYFNPINFNNFVAIDDQLILTSVGYDGWDVKKFRLSAINNSDKKSLWHKSLSNLKQPYVFNDNTPTRSTSQNTQTVG